MSERNDTGQSLQYDMDTYWHINWYIVLNFDGCGQGQISTLFGKALKE